MKNRTKYNPLTQEDRQKMLSADLDTYVQVRTSVVQKRQEEAQKKREAVFDIFTQHVRPKMEINKAYSVDELVTLYWALGEAKNKNTMSLFRFLLLNKSDFLKIQHVCSMPKQIIIDEVPRNAVANYVNEVENLRQRGQDFMNETGMEVKLPKPANEKVAKAVYKAAVILQESGECVRLTRWEIKIQDYYCALADSSTLQMMERMGIKFRELKTVSAFWIDC